jgi:hypothetical protein
VDASQWEYTKYCTKIDLIEINNKDENGYIWLSKERNGGIFCSQ